ncbi:unnamed protein product [Notodromas monacha]|uniref:Protein farnesyltransferase subunit beta n=1 Tax=Notodromas monacha TaxID=399045 RepID=A0A7R9BKY6_9CRUS|nr:unnamed protein product [Notodromas monacha]CAG0917395.1 unnamed protein product [Notodromas monacha]
MADKTRNFAATMVEERHKDNDNPTQTTMDQGRVESDVARCYSASMADEALLSRPVLIRQAHAQYLRHGLSRLSTSYQHLDSSRPWLVYWILHSLELLEEPISDQTKHEVVDFLRKCQNPSGGYGGGPGQISHLAVTYAAVNALCIIGTKEAYDSIDRPALQWFLARMLQPNGSFASHTDGEVDIRGAYVALAVARLLNILCPEICEGTAAWVASCQTYEGGFAGIPGCEAHGGYTYCGAAALILLDTTHLCDIQGLVKWAANRQMRLEGGFQGRTNKLVDSCYSFWVGALFPLLEFFVTQEETEEHIHALNSSRWLFHQEALQEYLLHCAQSPKGGFVDKPGKPADFYHTCYALSGLSVAQHFKWKDASRSCIVGEATNELATVHPLFNIGLQAATDAQEYFGNLKVPSIQKRDGDASAGDA